MQILHMHVTEHHGNFNILSTRDDLLFRNNLLLIHINHIKTVFVLHLFFLGGDLVT